MDGQIFSRRAKAADVPMLKNLWQEVFGDTDAEIGAFFEVFFDTRLCVLAGTERGFASMGYLLPVGDLRIPGQEDVQCAMIYAVATAPKMRGMGCAERVTNELLAIAAERRFHAVVLHPAEPSLFDYYEKKANLRTAFSCTQESITVSPGDTALLRRVDGDEYISRREALLADMPHIAFDRRAVLYQQRLCGSGGLFFAGNGCAVIEARDGEVKVKELLGAGEAELSAIAAAFPAAEYVVRKPGNDMPFGMINGFDGFCGAWYGFDYE